MRRNHLISSRGLIGLIGLLGLMNPMSLNAQPRQWSLRECCDYAVSSSISIKQRENQCRQQEIQLSTAKNSRLPDLSGSVSQNFSFGRGLTADNSRQHLLEHQHQFYELQHRHQRSLVHGLPDSQSD